MRATHYRSALTQAPGSLGRPGGVLLQRGNAGGEILPRFPANPCIRLSDPVWRDAFEPRGCAPHFAQWCSSVFLRSSQLSRVCCSKSMNSADANTSMPRPEPFSWAMRIVKSAITRSHLCFKSRSVIGEKLKAFCQLKLIEVKTLG